MRSEGNWQDYLAFASRIHKHSFDNALLVYAQNPNVTALASTAQWNKAGRYVNKGAQGVAVCEYDNAKLTVTHLFDLSQTNGRTVIPTDWQLSDDMKTALTNRISFSHGYPEGSFPELIYALSVEAAAENYESYLSDINAYADNHIFSQLPPEGLEAQFIELLADSTSYFIGKRCSLPDEEILTYDGMRTINHFNTIPLAARLGNAVTTISKGILIEMERTIRIINTERTEHNERAVDTTGLYREGRDHVPESANLEQRRSGSTPRTVWQNGAGISEGQPPRPIYSFENGWQADGGHAQGSERSDRENRSDDTAGASQRPAPADGGHIGEDTPPEQPETVGGGNRDTGNRADTPLILPEELNSAERESSNDGSFSSPENGEGEPAAPSEADIERVLTAVEESDDENGLENDAAIIAEIEDIPHTDEVDNFIPNPVSDSQIVTLPQRPKNDMASRNYRLFAKLFPQIVSGEYESLRLSAGESFDPLVISHKYDDRYCMEHYYLQNGDRMYDPYMEFLIDTEAGTMQAASYEQSSLGMYQEVYTENGWRPGLQKELNSFLSNWLKNISSQGYEPVSAYMIVNGEDQHIDLAKEKAQDEPLVMQSSRFWSEWSISVAP